MYKKELLLKEYTPLVYKIASGFIRKLPRTVLRDDLVAAGLLGLWDAINRHLSRYDGKNSKYCDSDFEWYARVRIRGAILDELRTQDWLPRRARARATEGKIVPMITYEGDLSDEDTRQLQFTTSAEDLLIAAREQKRLIELVEGLPLRERFIIIEHYFVGTKFKDIATEMSISEPRVSQLHARAINRMYQFVEDLKNGFAIGTAPKPERRPRVRVPHQ